MTLKKKIAITALSAALTMGSLGSFATAATNDPFPRPDLLSVMKKIHDELTPTEKQSVRDARTELSGIDEAEWRTILAEVLENLQPTLNDDPVTGDITTLIEFIRELSGLFYSDDAWRIEDLRTDEDYRAVFDKLALKAGLGATDLTISDFADFLFDGQIAVNTKLSTLGIADLQQLKDNDQARKSFAKKVLEPLLLDTSKYDLSKVFTEFYDPEDTEDLADVFAELLGRAPVTEGSIALFNAYLRAYPLSNSSGGGGDGGTGTGGGTTTTGNQSVIATLAENLGVTLTQIANATPAELQVIVNKAVADTINALAASNGFTADMKQTDGTKATVTINSSSVSKAVDELIKLKENLTKILEEAGQANKLPPILLTIALPASSESDVDFKLTADLTQKLKDAGLDGVKLETAEYSVELPAEELNGGTTFSSSSSTPEDAGLSDEDEENAQTNVFSFGLFSETISPGGTVTLIATSFDVGTTVSFTVTGENGAGITLASAGNLIASTDGSFLAADTKKFDPDLLTLAQVGADGKLTALGGKYNAETGMFEENRDQMGKFVVIENKVSFEDTAKVQSWAGRQIEVIAATGAIEGRAPGVFAPSESVTRAEFAKILTRALDYDNANAKESFNDVADNSWAAPYIGAAAKLGIIQGRSSGIYDPSATITRAEIATMVSRALKLKHNLGASTNVEASLAKFSDSSSIPATLREGVAFAAENNIIVGNNGKFNPNDKATRAEAVVMLYRAFKFEPQE